METADKRMKTTSKQVKSGPKLLAKLLHVCFLKAIGLALILSQKLNNLLSNPESSN